MSLHCQVGWGDRFSILKLEPGAGLQSVHTASPSTQLWLFLSLGDTDFFFMTVWTAGKHIRLDLPLLRFGFMSSKCHLAARAAVQGGTTQEDNLGNKQQYKLNMQLSASASLDDCLQLLWHFRSRDLKQFTLQSVVGHLFKITRIVAWKTVRSSVYFSLLMSSFPYGMYELYVGRLHMNYFTRTRTWHESR